MGDAEKEPLVKIETCAVHQEPLVRVDDHLVCPFRGTGCTVLFRPKLPTPPYVHGLLDAFLTRRPLDFAGADVPPDVQARLEGAVATGELGTVPHSGGRYAFGEQAARPLTVDRDTVDRFLAEVGVALDEWQRSILREVLITPAGLRATYLRRGESRAPLAFGDDAMAYEVVDIPFARKPRRDADAAS